MIDAVSAQRETLSAALRRTAPPSIALDPSRDAADTPFEVEVTAASPIGRRVVSRREFSRGDAIWPVSGMPTTPSPRTIQVSATRHVEDGGALAYLNHSCQPSIVIDTSSLVMLFALRDIEKGEELTLFYPSTEWDMVRPFVCGCGAPQCVRIVAGARYLSVDVLSRYFITAHIRHLVTTAIARPWHPSTPDRKSDAMLPRRSALSHRGDWLSADPEES